MHLLQNVRVIVNSIYTFASDSKKVINRQSDKVTEIKFEKNLMGKLLLLALEQQDRFVITYGVSLNTCSIFVGSYCWTKQVNLFSFKHLEIIGNQSTHPTKVDCTLVDVFIFSIFIHWSRRTPNFWKISSKSYVKNTPT